MRIHYFVCGFEGTSLDGGEISKMHVARIVRHFIPANRFFLLICILLLKRTSSNGAVDDENVTLSGRKSSGSQLLRFIVNSFEFAIFHVAAK